MKMTRRQAWWILGLETFFLIVLAAWLLSRLGQLFEPTALAVAIAIVVVGNLITVLLMQRFTRTEITLSPGESAETFGRVVSGFNDSMTGQVSVRGEQWQATTVSPARLLPGDAVRVVSRRGLTLTVEPEA